MITKHNAYKSYCLSIHFIYDIYNANDSTTHTEN